MAKPSFLLPGLTAAWLAASPLGFWVFGAHLARPGEPGVPPGSWPAGTLILRPESGPTLLIFIHPRCPCSRASLAELDRFSSRRPGRFAGRAIVYRPDGAGDDWSLPASPGGLTSFVDVDGREAARFGVETSGHVLLFNPAGRRVYSGGITISRGHRGDNPGLDRLGEALDRGTAGGSAPVFGCPVVTPVNPGSRRSPP